MKEVILRISQMTHMDNRSLTNDFKLMSKVHKFVGDFYKMMLAEESKFGYIENVSPEQHYTDYNNIRELIHRCYALTDKDKLSLLNELIVVNKVHELTTNYFKLLNHEERQINIEKYYS
jgi:hypothetical protein